MRLPAAILGAAGALAIAAPGAGAAGPPQAISSWVTDVTASSGNLRAQINPNGLSTTYRFEYVTQTAFEASGFVGASKAPFSGAAPLGSGTSALSVVQTLSALTPQTTYRYRPVATNSAGTTTGLTRSFTTQATSLVFSLPEARGWELVSPADKGGGSIASPGQAFGGGAFQAAAQGGRAAYVSASAFGDAPAAPPASQYLSSRTASGWPTENLSAPLDSAAYGEEPDGSPYRIFSTDLSKALLYGGAGCRGEVDPCAPTQPLPGTGAPPGYANYYLRDSDGDFEPLIDSADLAHSAVTGPSFEVDFAAATPSLSHVALSSCAALSADATEVMSGIGECDQDEPSLYLWSSSGLELVNRLPGESEGAPGAQIAAPIGAVSSDGARVYFTHDGNLYLRQGNTTTQVDEALGGGGTFETASADGSIAFLSKEGHLHRFIASTKAITDLTPAGGVSGVLGASEDGSRVYFQDTVGLKLWNNGTTTTVAPGTNASAPSNFPPATGTARVSPSGSHLAFLSTQELTAYDNAGQTEAFIYGPPPEGGPPALNCASCNPTGERAQGSSSIPGALVNGSTRAYKPRALSAEGSRLFFDSKDELVLHDTNSRPDVYMWRAKGVGCALQQGCVALISSGRALEGATFVDASANGSDAYFTTDESLVKGDPGSIDLYDARVGGGFPAPPNIVACVADACQSLPAPPDDPTPGTLRPNTGNPAPRIVGEKAKAKRCRKGKVRRKGHCVKRAERGGRR